jgi:hypothetical protein
MIDPERLDLDPITLGHKAALGVLRPAETGETRAVTAEERVRLLNDAASSLGLYHQPFWIEARYGIALPIGWNEDGRDDFEEDAIPAEDDLEFAGTFNGYSRIKLGKLLGAWGLRRVSGLCATFDKAMIMSGMDRLEEDHMLHVPILAVDIVDRAPDFL